MRWGRRNSGAAAATVRTAATILAVVAALTGPAAADTLPDLPIPPPTTLPQCVMLPYAEPGSPLRASATLPHYGTGLGRAPSSTTGSIHMLVILVQFSDLPARVPASRFSPHLFGAGTTLRDFYAEVSRGQLDVTGDVHGWFTLPQSEFFYSAGGGGIGQYPNNGQRMTEDAVAAAVAGGVNLGDYDADGDGTVDALLIIHSGQGFEWAASGVVTPTADPDAINSHRWVVTDGEFGSGATVTDYFTCPELQIVKALQLPNWPDSIATIGVYCHEFGHILGLPDFYDTETLEDRVGQWDLMDYGTWNRDPATNALSAPGALPGGFSAWSRHFLQWETPLRIAPAAGETESELVVLITVSDGTGTSLQLLPNPGGVDWTPTAAGTGEYFLAEIRTKTGYDIGLPSEGLLLYHVDERNPTNRKSASASGGGLLVLVPQDGDFELQTGEDDPWPGAIPFQQLAFGPTSTPSSDFYDGAESGVSLSDLGGFDGRSLTFSATVSNLKETLPTPFARPHPWSPALHGDVELVLGFGATAGPSVVRVYDVHGRRVRELDATEEFFQVGRVARWDGRNEAGERVPPGMYFFRSEGAWSGAGRVVLLR